MVKARTETNSELEIINYKPVTVPSVLLSRIPDFRLKIKAGWIFGDLVVKRKSLRTMTHRTRFSVMSHWL